MDDTKILAPVGITFAPAESDKFEFCIYFRFRHSVKSQLNSFLVKLKVFSFLSLCCCFTDWRGGSSG